MLTVNITRNLIGLEDLLTGEGIVEQTRAETSVNITKINAKNFPYEEGVTLDTKLTEILNLAQSLSVVDEFGNFLTGYLNTSDDDLNLEGRLWRKTPSADVAELYYGTVRVLGYNRVTGDLIIPDNVNYVAADVVVTAALTAYVDAQVVTLNATITALDDSLGSAALLNVGTAALEVVQLDASAKLPAVDGSQLTNMADSVPIGAIFQVPYSTPDTTYLECDGSEISRTTYATLFGKIGVVYGVGNGSTTFNLPDYRGEFLRGWDNGRGIDAGRVLGSNQLDELKSHFHKYSSNLSGSGGGTESVSSVSSVKLANTQSTGGVETRPRNVSVMYQIKVL